MTSDYFEPLAAAYDVLWSIIKALPGPIQSFLSLVLVVVLLSGIVWHVYDARG